MASLFTTILSPFQNLLTGFKRPRSSSSPIEDATSRKRGRADKFTPDNQQDKLSLRLAKVVTQRAYQHRFGDIHVSSGHFISPAKYQTGLRLMQNEVSAASAEHFGRSNTSSAAKAAAQTASLFFSDQEYLPSLPMLNSGSFISNSVASVAPASAAATHLAQQHAVSIAAQLAHRSLRSTATNALQPLLLPLPHAPKPPPVSKDRSRWEHSATGGAASRGTFGRGPETSQRSHALLQAASAVAPLRGLRPAASPIAAANNNNNNKASAALLRQRAALGAPISLDYDASALASGSAAGTSTALALGELSALLDTHTRHQRELRSQSAGRAASAHADAALASSTSSSSSSPAKAAAARSRSASHDNITQLQLHRGGPDGSADLFAVLSAARTAATGSAVPAAATATAAAAVSNAPVPAGDFELRFQQALRYLQGLGGEATDDQLAFVAGAFNLDDDADVEPAPAAAAAPTKDDGEVTVVSPRHSTRRESSPAARTAPSPKATVAAAAPALSVTPTSTSPSAKSAKPSSASSGSKSKSTADAQPKPKPKPAVREEDDGVLVISDDEDGDGGGGGGGSGAPTPARRHVDVDPQVGSPAAYWKAALTAKERQLLHTLLLARDASGQLLPVPSDVDMDQRVGQFDVDYVSLAKIQCLAPRQWLNDEVINFLLRKLNNDNRVLCESNGVTRPPPDAPASALPPPLDHLGTSVLRRAHVWNTQFLTLLLSGPKTVDGGYFFEGVKRWTKKAGVVMRDLELIVVPIHLKIHWALAVLDLVRRQLHYYDSMSDEMLGMRGEHVQLKALLRWVGDETEAQEGPQGRVDASLWPIIRHGDRSPQQENGTDCGEFMAQYARCIMTGVPFDFTQDDIPRMRNRHALLIAQTEVAPAHRK